MNAFQYMTLVITVALGLASTGLAGTRSVENLQVKGTTVFDSCKTYIGKTFRGSLELRDASIPWGSTLTVHFGFERRDTSSDATKTWQRDLGLRRLWEDEMAPAGPFTWKADLGMRVHNDGDRYENTGLNFAIEVVEPSGAVSWIKGSNTSRGYYRIEAPEAHSCGHAALPKDFEESGIEVEVVEQD